MLRRSNFWLCWGFGKFPSFCGMFRHFTMGASKIPSVIFLNLILLAYASGFDRRLSFLPRDKNILSWGVSFLEQKRAVCKWKKNLLSVRVDFTVRIFCAKILLVNIPFLPMFLPTMPEKAWEETRRFEKIRKPPLTFRWWKGRKYKDLRQIRYF